MLAGGRGKGRFAKYPKGGVQLLYSAEEIEAAAKGMIGDFLITKQTGAEGRICNSVMITERKYTRKEYYLAFMNDRKFNVSYKKHIKIAAFNYLKFLGSLPHRFKRRWCQH